jgi:hypothetical protein
MEVDWEPWDGPDCPECDGELVLYGSIWCGILRCVECNKHYETDADEGWDGEEEWITCDVGFEVPKKKVEHEIAFIRSQHES